MTKNSNPKQKAETVYDLEDRTAAFSKRTRNFIKKIQKNITNIFDCKQVIKSTGSVGANYIEANEALSKKDFIFRIKICRKEAKESKYWFRLMGPLKDNVLEKERKYLIKESTELMKIFGSILESCKS